MLDALKQQLAHTGEVIAGVKADQMGDRTPCEKFDVKELINHIIGGNYFMADVASGKPVNPDPNAPLPDLIGKDADASYEQSMKAVIKAFGAPDIMQRTFKFPFGEMPAAMGFGLALTETTVHAWDLARATGQDETIDPQLATMLLEGAKQGISDEFRTGDGAVFKAAVKVPDSASPAEKLVAFLGRKP